MYSRDDGLWQSVISSKDTMAVLHILTQKRRINHQLIGFSKAAQRFSDLLKAAVCSVPCLSTKRFLYKKPKWSSSKMDFIPPFSREAFSLCTSSTHFMTPHFIKGEATSSTGNLMPPSIQLLFSPVSSCFPHFLFFSTFQ